MEARLGACEIFAFLPRIGPAPASPLFVFGTIEQLQAAFLKMTETRFLHFLSLMKVWRNRLFAFCLSSISSLKSNCLLRDLPPKTGINQSTISLIADEAESIIPDTC